MKRVLTLFVVLAVLSSQTVSAQLFKKVLGDSKSKDTTKSGNASNILDNVLSGGKYSSLSSDEIVQGLKEALKVGAELSGQKLSAIDGYFANAAIKILMPEEAKNVEKKLRGIGLGKQVDN